MQIDPQIKKSLEQAIKIKSKNSLVSTLRYAARFAFKKGDKQIALELIRFAIDFSEQSNQYFLLIVDYHYYQTGRKLDQTHSIPNAPTPRIEEPWEELTEYIKNL
ncbi:hypothetical protein [Candidatus Harpocratesius sp.]